MKQIQSALNAARPWLLCSVAVSVSLGCEEDEPADDTLSKPVASAPAPTPIPSADEPPSEAPAAKEEEAASRPDEIDTELTDERRKAIEEKFSDAKGLLVASELEEKLKENEAVEAEDKAITTFDKMAKNKWVLFTGPMVNLTEDGFDLGVVYTPQMPNDPMGMSRQFFPVTLTDIEGYEEKKFESGDKVVVLAKYQGDAEAGPGHELIEAGVWQTE